jgi:ribosomal protein S18 acetylase RimI-like enzyme
MSDPSAARVTIRRFTAADEEGVVALWQQVFAADPPWNEARGMLARKLARDPELVLVACEGNAIIGSVLGGYDGVRGWIYHLAVAPGARGRGLGSELVRRIEAAIFALGCAKINLQVRATNRGVVAFYEKLGYLLADTATLGKRREEGRG